MSRLIEVYGSVEGAWLLWNNLDGQAINDLVEETAEWRKPVSERALDKARENHERYLAENSAFVDNFFEQQRRKRGFVDASQGEAVAAANGTF